MVNHDWTWRSCYFMAWTRCFILAAWSWLFHDMFVMKHAKIMSRWSCFSNSGSRLIVKCSKLTSLCSRWNILNIRGATEIGLNFIVNASWTPNSPNSSYWTQFFKRDMFVCSDYFRLELTCRYFHSPIIMMLMSSIAIENRIKFHYFFQVGAYNITNVLKIVFLLKKHIFDKQLPNGNYNWAEVTVNNCFGSDELESS